MKRDPYERYDISGAQATRATAEKRPVYVKRDVYMRRDVDKYERYVISGAIYVYVSFIYTSLFTYTGLFSAVARVAA